VLEGVRKVIGMELLCAAQGLDFLKPLKPGAGVLAAQRELRKVVPHLDRDRFLQPELDRVTDPSPGLAARILSAVERAVGPLC
jgi:histidine ammonia-lyase